MLKRLTRKRSVVLASLAVLSVWMMTVATTAAPPAGNKNAPAAASPGATALEKAAKNNKYLFIFFWQEKSEQTNTMWGVFQTATKKFADRADAVQLNVADPAEKPIVDKFNVRGAPMPLVLAMAPNGAATRAFPESFDEAQLQEAFVTPCQAKCIKVIQDRRSILLCVQNDKTQFSKEAMQGVQAFKADPQYIKGTEIVVLNPADKAEPKFLKALQVDPQTTTAVTLLVTPPGAPIARFEGAVTKDEIEAKVKAAQSGCGPGCKCHQQ